MTASEYVVEVLGGPSVFKGRSVPTSTELRARIKQDSRTARSSPFASGCDCPCLRLPTFFTCRLGRWLGAGKRENWIPTNPIACIESRVWRVTPFRCLVRKTKRRRGCRGRIAR